MEEYCITSAKKFDNFNDQWIELRNLLNLLPITSAEWESKYKNKESIEIEDDENYYFLKINELRQAHETAPLGYVKKEIEILLLNKRKISFEENLEKTSTQKVSGKITSKYINRIRKMKIKIRKRTDYSRIWRKSISLERFYWV